MPECFIWRKLPETFGAKLKNPALSFSDSDPKVAENLSFSSCKTWIICELVLYLFREAISKVLFFETVEIISEGMVFVIAGSRGRSFRLKTLLFSGSVRLCLRKVRTAAEQGVLLKRRMLRTIFRRKTSATETYRPGKFSFRSKGEKVG